MLSGSAIKNDNKTKTDMTKQKLGTKTILVIKSFILFSCQVNGQQILSLLIERVSKQIIFG
jgi:hypothetical protein